MDNYYNSKECYHQQNNLCDRFIIRKKNITISFSKTQNQHDKLKNSKYKKKLLMIIHFLLRRKAVHSATNQPLLYFNASIYLEYHKVSR